MIQPRYELAGRAMLRASAMVGVQGMHFLGPSVDKAQLHLNDNAVKGRAMIPLPLTAQLLFCYVNP
jgi:hypothetical protein